MARILRHLAVLAVGLLFFTAPTYQAAAQGSHFSWGAEAGSSLDMTSHDLSSFDVDVMIGYKNSVIKHVGISTGIHRGIATGNNFIPLCFVLRTSLRRKPSPFFINLQGGYCFTSIGHSGSAGHAGSLGRSSTIGDLYGNLGVGLMLKMTGRARPYIVLSAACQHFSEKNLPVVELDSRYIFFSKIMIGVNF